MYIFDFNEDEIKMLIQSLRVNETNSRSSFGSYLKRLATVGSQEEEAILEKLRRAKEAWKKIADLRAKFGDIDPVKSDR